MSKWGAYVVRWLDSVVVQKFAADVVLDTAKQLHRNVADCWGWLAWYVRGGCECRKKGKAQHAGTRGERAVVKVVVRQEVTSESRSVHH
jgi:hypothetical protein